MKTQVLEYLNDKQLELNGLPKKKRVRSSTTATAKKPISIGEATRSALPKETEIDQSLAVAEKAISAEAAPVSPPAKQQIDPKKTKTAYTTWANDPGILRTGGKQYTIPEGTRFLKMTQNCPCREGFAEITFSEEVFRSFYPYELLPSKFAVVIPHSHLHISPKKGTTWKGAKR